MNAPMLQGQSGGLPRGELLGRYRSYEDAQKVVEHLASSEGFDIKNLSIVGNDLRTVEHIRTRLSYPRVALGGAAQGALFGAFIGLLIFTFSPDSTPTDIIMAVLMGMAIWMIIGIVGYSVRKGRRDFASSSQLVATTFDVVCDFSVAAHARRLVPGAGVASLGMDDDPTSAAASTSAPSPDLTPSGAGPAPAPVAPGVQGADSGEAAQQDGPRGGGGYDDLPDGRPRYGVRVGDRTPAPQEQTHDGAAETVGEPESADGSESAGESAHADADSRT